MIEEIALEMARIAREAEAEVRRRIADQQKGELWINIPSS